MACWNIGGAWDFFDAMELLQADGGYSVQSASSIVLHDWLKAYSAGVDS
jgi:hypothetical protein